MNDDIEGHAINRYDGESSYLNFLVVEMGGLVLQQVKQSLEAFKNRDIPLARQVIAWDREVDRMEVGAAAEIAKLIARRGPVGGDLREVMAVSKSIADLERIGNEAARVAGLAIQTFAKGGNGPSQRLAGTPHRIGELATTGLREAMEVIDAWDEDKARHVLVGYRDTDAEFQSFLRHLMTYLFEDSRNFGVAISLTQVAKSLERIGHHARNIVEHAIFRAKGEDIVKSGSLDLMLRQPFSLREGKRLGISEPANPA